MHSHAYLNKVARQLNERPRDALQFETTTFDGLSVRLRVRLHSGKKRLPEFLAGAFAFPVLNMRAPGASATTPEVHILDSRAEERRHGTADDVRREVQVGPPGDRERCAVMKDADLVFPVICIDILATEQPRIASIFTLRRTGGKLALILPYLKLLEAIGHQHIRMRQWTA